MTIKQHRLLVATLLLATLAAPAVSSAGWSPFRVVVAVATGGASEVVRSKPVKATAKVVKKTVKSTAKVVKEAATVVGKATVTTAIAPLKASVAVAVGLIEGKQPEDIWKKAADAYVGAPLRDTAHAGAVVVQGVSVVKASVYTEAENVMRSVGGDTGQQIAALTFMRPRLEDATGVSTAQYVDIVAHGGDPAMLVSVPLATALRQAYETHKGSAKPYPESVKAALRKIYPEDVIEAARYSVGKLKITLPDLINDGQRLVYGNDYAVTVGDITVYNTEPESYFWIGHEVRHTVQYRELGSFDGFAWSYIRHSSSMEANADDWGLKVAAASPQYANVAAAANLPGSYTEQLIARASVNVAGTELSCELAGQQATVEVDNWNVDGSGPCQVNFVKRASGPDRVSVIYYAQRDGSYCGLKASEFGDRLRSQGWTCSGE